MTDGPYLSQEPRKGFVLKFIVGGFFLAIVAVVLSGSVYIVSLDALKHFVMIIVVKKKNSTQI